MGGDETGRTNSRALSVSTRSSRSDRQPDGTTSWLIRVLESRDYRLPFQLVLDSHMTRLSYVLIIGCVCFYYCCFAVWYFVLREKCRLIDFNINININIFSIELK